MLGGLKQENTCVRMRWYLLLRYWAVKHLQNIGQISCGCHFGVYTCDYTCSIGNNSGALCINKCRHFLNKKYFLWHIRFTGPRSHTLRFYAVYVILHSHTHTCIMRVLGAAIFFERFSQKRGEHGSRVSGKKIR